MAESFSTPITPTDWSVINAGSAGWVFNNPHSRVNYTGGAGGFAIADSDHYGPGVTMSTELRSPVMNLSTLNGVTLTFKTDLNYYEFGGGSEVADVDVSADGGGTWSNVWQQTADARGPRQITLDLSALAGQPDVQLRFHYYNAVYDGWWQIDDVRLGQCLAPNIQRHELYLPLVIK